MSFVQSIATLFGYALLIQLSVNLFVLVSETFEFAYGPKKRLGIKAYSILFFFCVRFFQNFSDIEFAASHGLAQTNRVVQAHRSIEQGLDDRILANIHFPGEFDFPFSAFTETSGLYFKAGAYNKTEANAGASGAAIVRQFRCDLV